jgi:hypothetical protein
MMEDRFLKRLRKKSPEGTAGLADCDGCILWSEPKPSDEGHRWHHAIRECTGERVARLEGGSRRHPCRPRYRPGDIGIYRAASSIIGRDDRLPNWLPSPTRNRLRRRMVSSLRVFGTDEIALQGRRSIRFSLLVLTRWLNETSRVHHAPRRGGGRVADRGARHFGAAEQNFGAESQVLHRRRSD